MRFYNPVKINFDTSYKKAVESIKDRYNNILLVTSKGWLKRESYLQNISTLIIDSISPNPELSHLRELEQECKDFDAVIAIGGGSVIDSAKFLSVKSNDKLELLSMPKPLFAFPTTFGTSSELTKWATIWDKQSFKKHSLSDELLYPKEAYYDISLSLTLPRRETIHTALDTLSHSLESIWNANANPISTSLALEALKLILDTLPMLVEKLDSTNLRRQMALANVYAGLAFSNTQTALCHALSYPITMRFDTPHGLACSFSIPLMLDFLELNSHSYKQVADTLLPFKNDIKGLFERLDISSSLRDYGLDSSFLDEIFSTLNTRAKNSIFNIEDIKCYLESRL